MSSSFLQVKQTIRLLLYDRASFIFESIMVKLDNFRYNVDKAGAFLKSIYVFQL